MGLTNFWLNFTSEYEKKSNFSCFHRWNSTGISWRNVFKGVISSCFQISGGDLTQLESVLCRCIRHGFIIANSTKSNRIDWIRDVFLLLDAHTRSVLLSSHVARIIPIYEVKPRTNYCFFTCFWWGNEWHTFSTWIIFWKFSEIFWNFFDKKWMIFVRDPNIVSWFSFKLVT